MNVIIILGIIIAIIVGIIIRVAPRVVLHADKLFACSNCGHRFRSKWYDFGIITATTIDQVSKSLSLKCPQCKTRSMCGPPSL